ncbi:MAG: hypothetical protein R3Y63_02480 [Eubacteriales bacterium]
MIDLPLLKKRAESLDKNIAQSLHILQLPLGELETYLSEVAGENNMLEISPPENPLLFYEIPEDSWVEQFFWGDRSYWYHNNHWYQEEIPGWSEQNPPPVLKIKGQSFTAQLIDQLRRSPKVPTEFLPHCIFLAESLDAKGYFVEDLEKVAELIKIPYPTAEQLLFILQEMEPCGVGARNLQECLLLQLAKSPYFNQYTLKLISQEPHCFQPPDFKWISGLLDCSVPDAQKYWQMVRGFNPIPSSAFARPPCIPEAKVEVVKEKLQLHFLPQGRATVSLNQELADSAKKQRDTILTSYLQINQNSAENIISALEERHHIMESLISYVVAFQQDYFLDLGPLRSLDLKDLSSALNLSPNHLSRAICDKHLLAPQGIVSLKSLLTPESTGELETIERDSILSRLRMLIAGENKKAPYSDEKLKQLLEGFSIDISRRTVAKYRDMLHLPNASQRKRR